MKQTMLKQIFLCFITLAAVHASGDFVVLHSPGSIGFKGRNVIDQSLLKEVYAASFGFTVRQRGSWDGMFVLDPFGLPRAIVNVAVEGIDTLKALKGHKFPLNVDEGEETTWQALSGCMAERDNDNTLVRIYLGDGLDALGQSAMGELKPTAIDPASLKALSMENEEDKKFLEEVQLLYAIAAKVPSAIKGDHNPAVYWLVVSGLQPVFDLHGKNSTAAMEALTLLNKAINAVSEAFVNAYEGQVLVTAFTNDASQVRHTRSVILERETRDTASDNNENLDSTTTESNVDLSSKESVKQGGNEENKKKADDKDEEDTDTVTNSADEVSTIPTDQNSEIPERSNDNRPETEYEINSNIQSLGQRNLAKKYTENYPVIFNIILWFGIIFFFSLLAICIAIAEMDPGRDSIIYRMTSNRMKKDN